jgi:hypothetical protein
MANANWQPADQLCTSAQVSDPTQYCEGTAQSRSFGTAMKNRCWYISALFFKQLTSEYCFTEYALREHVFSKKY